MEEIKEELETIEENEEEVFFGVTDEELETIEESEEE